MSPISLIQLPKSPQTELKLLPREEYGFTKNHDPMRIYFWPLVGKLFRRRVEYCLDQCQGGEKILEVGFGSGATFLALNEKYKHIYGIDLDTDVEAVENLYERYHINHNLKIGNLIDLPYEENTFDTVLLISILEHVKPIDLQQAMGEIKRVLKVGGQMVYGVPIERPLMRIGFWFLGYDIRKHHFSTENQVRTEAEKYFNNGHILRMPLFHNAFGCSYEIASFY